MREVPIEADPPGAFQPRRNFDEAELEALAQSIREKGVLQPLLVRPVDEARGRRSSWSPASGAGARRSAPGCTRCRSLVRELADAEALEIALVENLQREDLSALEEAEAYRRLMQRIRPHPGDLGRGGRQEPQPCRQHAAIAVAAGGGAAAAGGAARSAPAMRARCWARPDPAALAAEIVRRGLNVRTTERLVQAPHRAADGDARARRATPTPRRWSGS